MSSFTWKRPRDLETQQGRETPQDLETRYEGADIEPASLAAWRLLMEQLISSADPAIAFIGFLETMQALPERPLSQPRVFVSHRRADAPYAERIAWLASRKAGLEYWLDVHDPVLRLASAALPPGHPVYAITVAAIIEMALLNCTHVIAAHTPPPPDTSWRPSQWISLRARPRQEGRQRNLQAGGGLVSSPSPPTPSLGVSTYCLLTSAAATPMSNGGCKAMRTDRSWSRRTTGWVRPIRYPSRVFFFVRRATDCLRGS